MLTRAPTYLALTAVIGLILGSVSPEVRNYALSTLALAETPGEIAESVPDSPPAAPIDNPPVAAAEEASQIAESALSRWPFSPFSGPVMDTPALNFGVVEEGILSRSAQPTRENFRWFREQGIKGVVSFRRETGDDRAYVLSHGFRNFLWLTIEDETPPTHQQAEVFLSFVTDPRNWPVLIFCKVGLGRTGTMAALVRYAIDGWSMDEAIRESRVYRGGIELVPVQIDFLRGWAREHPPASHRLWLDGLRPD
ncbi:MAG: hypothetical protein HYX92_00935 [Chloroflexi bacterium]|nr:hypothetical protein [Chloroflexota bacterium]